MDKPVAVTIVDAYSGVEEFVQTYGDSLGLVTLQLTFHRVSRQSQYPEPKWNGFKFTEEEEDVQIGDRLVRCVNERGGGPSMDTQATLILEASREDIETALQAFEFRIPGKITIDGMEFVVADTDTREVVAAGARVN